MVVAVKCHIIILFYCSFITSVVLKGVAAQFSEILISATDLFPQSFLNLPLLYMKANNDSETDKKQKKTITQIATKLRQT